MPEIDLAGWAAAIPPAALERARAEGPLARETAETPEDRDARLALGRAAGARRWRERLAETHAAYAGVTWDALDAQQRPDDLRRWVEDPDALTLFVVGYVGVGKTHAAVAVGAEFAARGARVAIWSWRDWIAAVDWRREHAAVEAAVHDATTADLLILDDLGVGFRGEPFPEWVATKTETLVDARVRCARRTVITTNLGGDQLAVAFDDRTLSRLSERRSVVAVTGPDRRGPR